MSDPKSASAVKTATVAVTRAKEWFGRLSRATRVLVTSTVAAALCIGGLVFLDRANEPYAALFSRLDRDDASAIAAKLKELKVPYRVDADGTTIEVPESRARELRLDLAGEGLPRGGGVGFESFDKMRLGATDFEQRVLYRRALEGELARTIATLNAVESARVHLVLPESSVFVVRSAPASASIALRLRPGRALGPTEVSGIVHLVASAIPSLEADRITVVTTDGTLLHRPHKSGSSDASGADEDDESGAVARVYETSLEDRVRSMLEKVVGIGHADVRVTAEIDPARIERLEEHFDPTKSVLRSEERSIERTSGELDDTVAGVPGAESNLPTGAAKGASTASAKPAPTASSAPGSATPPATSALASGILRESHTRNYELDHVTEKRIANGGELKRLTVAVVLDGTRGANGPVARSREELDQLAKLVKTAAGASDARGDVVTVESMSFVLQENEGSTDTVRISPWENRLDLTRRWAPLGLGTLVVLAVAIGAMRYRGSPGLATLPAMLSREPAPPHVSTSIAPLLDSGDLRAKAHARAAGDPATAALVLRFWLGTSATDARDTKA